jgi:hypothetical protein
LLDYLRQLGFQTVPHSTGTRGRGKGELLKVNCITARRRREKLVRGRERK